MTRAAPSSQPSIVLTDGRLRQQLDDAIAAREEGTVPALLSSETELLADPTPRAFLWITINQNADHPGVPAVVLAWFTPREAQLEEEIARQLPEHRIVNMSLPSALRPALLRAESAQLPVLGLRVRFRNAAEQDAALNLLIRATLVLSTVLAAHADGAQAGSRPPALVTPARAYAGRPQPGDPDLLNYGRYADAIAAVIRHHATQSSLTIAIDAPWGLGKSALLDQIRLRLTDPQDPSQGRPSQRQEGTTEGDQPIVPQLRQFLIGSVLPLLHAVAAPFAVAGILLGFLLWWAVTKQQESDFSSLRLLIIGLAAIGFWSAASFFRTDPERIPATRFPTPRTIVPIVAVALLLIAIVFVAQATPDHIGRGISAPLASAVKTYVPTATPTCPPPATPTEAPQSPAPAVTPPTATTTPPGPATATQATVTPRPDCITGPKTALPGAVASELSPTIITLLLLLVFLYALYWATRLSDRRRNTAILLFVATLIIAPLVYYFFAFRPDRWLAAPLARAEPGPFLAHGLFVTWALLLGWLYHFGIGAWRRPSTPIVMFNAWHYAQEEALVSALTLQVIATLRASHSLPQRLRLEIQLRRDSLDFLYLPALIVRALTFLIPISLIATIVYSLLSSLGSDPNAEKTARVVTIATALLGAFLTIGRDLAGLVFRPAGRLLAPYFRQQDYRAFLGNRVRFREDFARLVRLARNQGTGRENKPPLVIMIEDLDRCAPPRPVEVIEALTPILDTEGCVFLLALDSRSVAASIAARYKDLADYWQQFPDDRGTPLGPRFLERLIDLPFRLPLLTPAQLGTFTDSLLGELSTPLDQHGHTHDPRDTPPTAPTTILAPLLDPPSSEQPVTDLRVYLRRARRGEETYRVTAQRLVLDGLLPNTTQLAQSLAELDLEEFDRRGDIREAIKAIVEHLDGTPRQVKRFINLFRLNTILIASAPGDLPAAASEPLVIAAATLFGLRWPDASDIPPMKVLVWLEERLSTEQRAAFRACLALLGIPHERLLPSASR